MRFPSLSQKYATEFVAQIIPIVQMRRKGSGNNKKRNTKKTNLSESSWYSPPGSSPLAIHVSILNQTRNYEHKNESRWAEAVENQNEQICSDAAGSIDREATTP